MKSETAAITPIVSHPDVQSEANGELPDAAVVARVLKGDRGAFEILVRRYQSALYRRALWMGLDPDTASDMVQDAFVKAYQHLDRCRDASRFGYWTGRILRNRILDFLKSADRREVPLSPTISADFGDCASEEERSTLRSLLHEALALLPDDQREAFLMKHAEGCTYEEMAEWAETSVSAMKMRVHRARETLRGHFNSTAVQEECDPADR